MKLIKEPLFQFVILGIALFAVFAMASDRLASDESATIRITPTDVELLSATFERQWQRPPIDT